VDPAAGQAESHVTDPPGPPCPVRAAEPQPQPSRCDLPALPTAPNRQPMPGDHQRHRPPHRRPAHVRQPGDM